MSYLPVESPTLAAVRLYVLSGNAKRGQWPDMLQCLFKE